MIRRPPKSTLFPYTTRSRSHRAQLVRQSILHVADLVELAAADHRAVEHVHHGAAQRLRSVAHRQDRSEEHTSELPSRQYLVCRLLLEKNPICTPFLSSSATC